MRFLIPLLPPLALMLAQTSAVAQRPARVEPQTFTWRAEWLQQARDRVDRGDAALRPALEELLREADEALRVEPLSVTQKRRLAPSGDRHDYMSMGPYWWPNPATANGLPYIRRDGERNPESTEDFDSPRWNRMAEAVETLALAYHFIDREAYAGHATRLLRVWFLDPATRMNPHLEYGQAIPGITEGRGIGIIDTNELPRLLDATALLRRSPSWTDADHAGLQRWAGAYLDWLLTSEKGKDEADEHNNHGTWYDAQAAALALFTGRPEIARRIIEDSRSSRIAQHVNAAGEQPHELARTKAFSYSTMNLEGMAQLAEMGRHVGVDLWGYRPAEGGGIRQALDFLAPYANPARKWPHPQIEPAEPSGLYRHLRRAATVYDDPRYRQLADRMPEEVRRDRGVLLYP